MLPVVEIVKNLLQKCRIQNALFLTLRMHDYIKGTGLQRHPRFRNSRISLSSDIGYTCHAQQDSNGGTCLSRQASCSSLLIGYVKSEEYQNALDLYRNMQQYGSHVLSSHGYVSLLKACSVLQDLETGIQIFSEISQHAELHDDAFICSTLVNLFAKLGSMDKAKQAFDMFQNPNVVSWTALISGFAHNGQAEESLLCLNEMKQQGTCPSTVTYLCILKACRSIRSKDKCFEIHAEIMKKGYIENDVFLSSALIDVYCKCGLFADVSNFLKKLRVRDVVVWTALINGYVESEQAMEALASLDQMQHDDILPNATTFLLCLKACGIIGHIDRGMNIHTEIVKKGLEMDTYVRNTLVDMYASCGILDHAERVFDNLAVQDVISWNVLISAHVEVGHTDKSLKCLENMQNNRVSPNVVTYVNILKASTHIETTQKLHVDICIKGLEEDCHINSAMVGAYGTCGLVLEAKKTYEGLSPRSLFSANQLLMVYLEHGYEVEALYCIDQIKQEDIALDTVTLVCGLRACSRLRASTIGQEMHTMTVKYGLEAEYHVANTMVDMYAKCNLLAESYSILSNLVVPDAISWTAVINGYLENEFPEEALAYLEEMQQESIPSDAYALMHGLTASIDTGDTTKGCQIYQDIVKKAFERELYISNTLIDMYAKFGLIPEAQYVFAHLPVRDLVSWNALIAGYWKGGFCYEALHSMECMAYDGFSADEITFICCLPACGNIGCTYMGQKIHADIVKKGFAEDSCVGSAVVDIYAKCGLIEEAHYAFDRLLIRPLATWNALIAGYAQLGASNNVLHIFSKMVEQNMKGDSITFVNILSACSHSGHIDEGYVCFLALVNSYNILVTEHHFACMIDIYSRAGQLDKAIAMLNEAPLHPGIVSWLTLMAGCRKWGVLELGRDAFENTLQLQMEQSAPYVCFSNIHAEGNSEDILY